MSSVIRPMWADRLVADTSVTVYHQIVENGYLRRARLEVYSFIMWATAPGREYTHDGVTYHYNGAVSILDVRRFWHDVGHQRGSRVTELWKMGYISRLSEKRRDPITGNLMYYHVISGNVHPLPEPRTPGTILRDLVADSRDLLVEFTTNHIELQQFTDELTELLFSHELLERYLVPGSDVIEED